MKRDDNSLDSTLDRYLGQAGEPPAGQVASSVEAVWERLRPEAECSTPQAREMVTRRSHFTVAVAAVVLTTVAIGLYAAQRAGLLQAMFPVQQQSPAVSVNPVRERVTIGGVAESKEPVTTSNPRQPAGAADAEATQSQVTDAGTGPSRFAPESVRVPDAKGFMTSPEQVRSQASPLAFEDASIRLVPTSFPSGGGPWTATNGRFRADHAWVRGVIGAAYGVKAPQVKGGPDWIEQERYDFDAWAGNPGVGADQIIAMLRTLLTDRLKLAVHRSTEEAMVYTLVVAKNGSKLQDAKDGQRSYINWSGPGKVTFEGNATLLGLTNVLGGLLDIPVFDETGLNGNYNFSLEFTGPRDLRPRRADSPPDLFTAVEEQLGLQLRATKRSVEVVVIDRIERPSPN